MAQKQVSPTLTHEQQVQLLAKYPLAEVLSEQQSLSFNEEAHTVRGNRSSPSPR